MVKDGPTYRKALMCCLSLAMLFLFTSGCAPRPTIVIPPGFKPLAQETVYIAPFTNTLVPDIIAEPTFNDFVDNLNRKRNIPGIKFFAIIKDELKDVDPLWLEKQTYISGEMWSYIENSGCCSTEMRIKASLNLHQPGQQRPLQIFIPKEAFFEHDKSSIEAERSRFASELAGELSKQVLKSLDPQN